MISIFVAKLDFGVDNAQLRSLFEPYGKVNKATVATDKETGRSRGFGFVEMDDESEGTAAIEALDGFSVNGRTIAVKKAEDRGDNRNQGPRPEAPLRNEGYQP
jgi:RNA recognition motif-containing protein